MELWLLLAWAVSGAALLFTHLLMAWGVLSGPLAARWRRGGALALGHLRRAGAPWVSVDLAPLSDVLGVPLAGVL